MACSAVITRAPAAAVELADTVPGDRADLPERLRRVGEQQPAPRPVRTPTSSGWAMAVSRMVSASASVP